MKDKWKKTIQFSLMFIVALLPTLGFAMLIQTSNELKEQTFIIIGEISDKKKATYPFDGYDVLIIEADGNITQLYFKTEIVLKQSYGKFDYFIDIEVGQTVNCTCYKNLSGGISVASYEYLFL